MSLTKQDLTDIRDTMLDALDVAVNPRLESLEGQMDSIDTRLNTVEGQLIELSADNRAANRRLSSIEKKLSKLDDIEGQLQAIEDDI